MARQIIILENQNPGRGATDPISYRYAFWLSVPAARQSFFANASATSAVIGLSAPELTAIQNGSIKELAGVFTVVPGTTVAQIEASLAAQFTAAQAALNSAAANAWDHYGTTWDGATWTLNTVA
jgi:hypothetical protein